MSSGILSIKASLILFFTMQLLNCASFPQPENYAALPESDSLGITYFNRILKLTCTKADSQTVESCEPYDIVSIKKLLPLVSKNQEDITYQGSDKRYHYFILWIKITKGQNEIFWYAVRRSECTLKPELSILDIEKLGPKSESYAAKMLNINGKCIVQTSE